MATTNPTLGRFIRRFIPNPPFLTPPSAASVDGEESVPNAAQETFKVR
jgi:hypothetical protein